MLCKSTVSDFDNFVARKNSREVTENVVQHSVGRVTSLFL